MDLRPPPSTVSGPPPFDPVPPPERPSTAGLSARLPQGGETPATAVSPRSGAARADPAETPLDRAVALWLSDGRALGWSPKTVKNRMDWMRRLIWYIRNEVGEEPVIGSLSPTVIRAFIAYAREAHPTGRWGQTNRKLAREPAKPSTALTAFKEVRSFVRFLEREGLIPETVRPLRNVRAPRVPKDEVPCFSAEQLQELLNAARKTKNPERDVALLMVLIDTGLRVGEICSLTVGDVDRGDGALTVVGKGGKRRTVYMGRACRLAVWKYLEADRREAFENDPLFAANSNRHSGSAINADAVNRLLLRLNKTVGIEGVRMSPHSFRHTFAINFLRADGNPLELQRLLGHDDLTMTRRYVSLSGTDLREAHRRSSPADRLKLR